jgi:predicted ribosomally synthesized peptide with nif11-like leader
MSLEDLKAYSVLCMEDEGVMAKAKEANCLDIDAQIVLAAENGLTFTHGDVDSLAKEIGAGSTELSEDDLENVAGGVGALAGLTAAAAGASAAVAVASSGSSRNYGW